MWWWTGTGRRVAGRAESGRAGSARPVQFSTGVATAAADDTGYLVVTGTGGVYDARPDGLHRITSGALLAVGRTRWLTTECDDRHHCATVVIDRNSGVRRVLSLAVDDSNTPYGVISPTEAPPP